MKPLKANIRQAIDDYFAQSPNGLDVTAFALDRIGRVDMENDAKTTHRSLDQAKQEIGRLISGEILPSMFHDVEPLDLGRSPQEMNKFHHTMNWYELRSRG